MENSNVPEEEIYSSIRYSFGISKAFQYSKFNDEDHCIAIIKIELKSLLNEMAAKLHGEVTEEIKVNSSIINVGYFIVAEGEIIVKLK